MNEITLPKDWITYHFEQDFSNSIPDDLMAELSFYTAFLGFAKALSKDDFAKFFGQKADIRHVMDRFSALSIKIKGAVIKFEQVLDRNTPNPYATTLRITAQIGPGFFEFLENLDKENEQ